MDTKKTKEALEEMVEVTGNVELLDKAIRQIKENDLVIKTKFGISVTMVLDQKTKDIIRAIVVPQIEEKREELVKYIDEKLNGGIVK